MKILAIGKNYVHEGEDKLAGKTGHQIIFSKPESSLVKNNDAVKFPEFTQDLRYEAELVIKIGKVGKGITVANAHDYIESLAIGIDFTAKDVFDQSRNEKGPWDLGKGFDGAAPISDFLPIENFKNLDNINFGLSINGIQKQSGNTSLMIYNFAEIIAFVSKFMTLEPGDLIFTGTPASGTGQTHIGDHLIASIESKEMLNFKVID